MPRTAIFAGFAAVFAGLSPAAAGSVSVGVGVGVGVPGYYGPGYYGPGYYAPYYHRRHYYAPPAVVYATPPVIYEPAPPPVVYAPPPVVYAPPSALPADAVFNRLERAGYSQFGVMAFRDGVYKVDAVNARGDRVSLEVSALNGAVQAEYVIGAARPPRTLAPSGKPGDPLVVY